LCQCLVTPAIMKQLVTTVRRVAAPTALYAFLRHVRLVVSYDL